MKDATRLELRYLLGVLRPYRVKAGVIIITSFLSSLADGVSIGMLIPLLSNIQGTQDGDQLPQVVRWATEALGAYPVSTQIYLSISLVVVSIILKNVLLGVSIYLGYQVSSGMAADLRSRAVTMLLDVDLEFHHQNKIGELVEKTLNNTASLEDLVRHTVEMVAQIITFFVLFSLLVLLSWKLTLIIVLIGAVFMWITALYTRRLSTIAEDFALSSRELMSSMYENLGGIQLIKTVVREVSQRDRICGIISRHRLNTLQLNFRNYGVHLLTDVLGALAIGVLFVVTMTVYDLDSTVLVVLLLPFVYVITRIIPVLKQINIARAVIQSRWPFMRIVHEFLRLDDKPFVKDGDRTFAGLERELQFDGVTFQYTPEAAPALKDVSFSLERGKTTAFVGRSGSGKSTIINLLMRFYDVQQGTVLADGIPLDTFDVKSFRQHVGVVSQDVFIFNDSVRYNIAFGADVNATEEQIIDAARRAGAHEFILELTKGYDTVLGERGVLLSGGQRQRISIARAILRNPEILILDEATSSLDTRTEEQIHQAIDELGRNRTVLVIAHRLSTIENADKIVVMKEGRVVEQGTAAELMAQGGEFHWLARRSTDQGEISLGGQSAGSGPH